MAFVGSCLPFAVVDILDLRIVVAVVEASDRRIAILKVASSTVNPSFVEVAFVQAVLEIVGEASYLVDPSFTVAFALGITAVAFPFVVGASFTAAVMGSLVAFIPSASTFIAVEDIPEAIVDNLLVLVTQDQLVVVKENCLVVVVNCSLPYVSFL